MKKNALLVLLAISIIMTIFANAEERNYSINQDGSVLKIPSLASKEGAKAIDEAILHSGKRVPFNLIGEKYTRLNFFHVQKTMTYNMIAVFDGKNTFVKNETSEEQSVFVSIYVIATIFLMVLLPTLIAIDKFSDNKFNIFAKAFNLMLIIALANIILTLATPVSYTIFGRITVASISAIVAGLSLVLVGFFVGFFTENDINIKVPFWFSVVVFYAFSVATVFV